MSSATKKPKLSTITETSTVAGKVDREAGEIRGVKLLGLVSRNGRRYSEQAVKDAAKLYAGATVYINHPAKPGQSRGYQERFGAIGESVEFRAGEGLVGTLKFNPKHPLAEQVCWDAEQETPGVGLSHNVKARTKRDKGGELVEEIAKVESVDLVDGPATTHSLFESEESQMPSLKEILESYKADAPAELQSLVETLLASPAMVEEPLAATPEPATDSDTIHSAFKAVLDSLLSVVMKVVGAKAAATPPPAVEVPPADEPPPSEPSEEEKKMTAEQTKKLADLETSLLEQTRRTTAYEVLAGFGIPTKKDLVEELIAHDTADKMKAVVEGWSGHKKGAQKPTMQAIAERKGYGAMAKYPEQHDGFSRALRR